MTLALLITAVTGAWAQGTLNVVEIEVPKAWETDNSNMTTADLTGFKASTLDEAKAWKGAPAEGYAMLIYAFDGDDAYYVGFNNGEPFSDHSPFQKNDVFANSNSMKFYYTAATGPEVAWNAATKTGTFAMPAFDVVLTPIYAKAAAFATTGTEPDVKTLLPEAAEGVIAGTDAPLIAEGTGIVAFAGTSTEDTQGTLMYAIGTSATEAPALTAFSATVPTAENIADDGADVYVWYYIQGANTPDGQEATAENTFNDTEICATPLTVTVLSNKFDLTLKAANANTIEAGKATVTVDGTAATVTEGKLQGVKMGSEVKMTTKAGYKFRKVEVKKQAADRAAAEATAEDIGKVIGADGNIYADAATATAAGATAVAMIAYVGSETGVDGYTHGLALALTDEASTMNWTDATGASGAAAHTPAAPTTTSSWMLPSKDQWNKMITAAGGYTALRDGFSGIAGASNLQSNFYWSSTEDDSNNANAWLYRFSNGQWYHDSKGYGDIRVRACLAF